MRASLRIAFVERDPWYFPDPASWTTDLKATGFWGSSVERFERPTLLRRSLGHWINTFGNGLLAGLDASARSGIKADAKAAAAPIHRRRDGTGILDCVRLRFIAIKPAMLSGQGSSGDLASGRKRLIS